MTTLFVSYAHVDKPQIIPLIDLLREAGYEPWFDQLLIPGQDWQHILRDHISKFDTFLYVLTPESVNSQWCQWEFAEAAKLHKPIIPVLLQSKTKLPDAISKFQYADLSDGLTIHAFAKLIRGINYAVPINVALLAPVNPIGLPAQAIADNPDTNDVTVTTPPATGAIKAVTIPTTYFETPDVNSVLTAPFEWCVINGGKVTLEPISPQTPSYSGNLGSRFSSGAYVPFNSGVSSKEQAAAKKKKTITVPQFYISKYPITYAQFQAFVNDEDGYENWNWWEFSEGAEEWHRKNKRPPTASVRRQNVPRTNVSWYDAVAFCRWLSSKISANLTLPTDAQWQRAAQGDSKHKYPWGDTFNVSRCNTRESGHDSLTGVTQYVRGASPYGVMDMSGNAREWCLSSVSNGRTELVSSEERIVRNGSFRNSSGSVNCSYRSYLDPDETSDDLGFRIVWMLE